MDTFKTKDLDAQEAVNKLCKYLLGDDWYIVDPVSCSQANAIIVDEIISRYKAVNESPANKWRRKHKRCRFCKHCEYTPGTLEYSIKPWCKVKKQSVNDECSRMFCKAFQLGPYEGV